MSDQRWFTCRVQEGTYKGKVSVCVNEEKIEMFGNKAIEDAAWREWRRTFGSSIGMCYSAVTIIEETEDY